jgi:hypothetical protein
MKRVILTFLFSVAGLFGLVATSVGQDDSFEANKQRWDAMSKEERAEIINAYRHWKSLDEAKRGEIVQRYQQFRALSDEDKVNVAVNLNRFHRMPPERQRILRKHLLAGPENWACQQCFMRIVSGVREANDGQPVDPKAVHQKFMEMQGRFFDEVIYPALSEEQRGKIDAIEDRQQRYQALRETVSDEIRKNPPPNIGDPGSPGYEMRLNQEVKRRSCEWAVKQLPPSMPEMAFFIRTHAFAIFPRERLMEIVNAPPEDVQSKVQALAATNDMARIIADMPEELHARYESFDDTKKLQVLVMAFRPVAEAGPRMFRPHFGPRHGPMPPPPGDTQPRPGERDHFPH